MLEVNRLSIYTPEQKPILQNISFTLSKGKTLGLIGMSGAGKTMLSLALLRLVNPMFHVKGDVQFQGKSLLSLPSKDMSRIRGKEIGFLTQHPHPAFDPIYTVGEQMIDTIRAHFSYTKKESRKVITPLLRSMAFRDPEYLLQRYPFELSGGMLQRVMITLMLALKPTLMIADEPTTALDTVTQREVLDQWSTLRDDQEQSMILVTHDLNIIGKFADEVLVLQSGVVVEHLTVEQLFTNPSHSYTKNLLRFYRKLNGGTSDGD
ncbi:ABC transporter ATP-binding protein [Salicibibacter kimchii]|nr:ABC transporter ATP-binding protein [Salicibibacter kimchii]